MHSVLSPESNLIGAEVALLDLLFGMGQLGRDLGNLAIEDCRR
jgi:hypothetical protein